MSWRWLGYIHKSTTVHLVLALSALSLSNPHPGVRRRQRYGNIIPNRAFIDGCRGVGA